MQQTNENVVPNLISWTDWLNSIANHPKNHGKIVQKGDTFLYNQTSLSNIHNTDVLSFQKILQISKKIFEQSTYQPTDMSKSLRGLVYIHEARKKRYENLFFICRWIAKFFGVEQQLDQEAKEIAYLRQCIEQRNSSLKPSENARVNPPNSINPPNNSAEPTSTSEPTLTPTPTPAQSNLDVSFSNFPTFEAFIDSCHGSRFEAFYAYSKAIRAFKEQLDPNHPDRQSIKDLEVKLAQAHPHFPRLKDMIKAWGEEVLKPTFKETIDILFERIDVANRPSENERQRDASLFGCLSTSQLNALYVQRFLKSCRTGFSLSLISAIEKTWKEVSLKPEAKAEELQIGNFRVLMLPGLDGEVYVKEEYINEGGEKTAISLTNFFQAYKKSDRNQFVILQPSAYVTSEELEELSSRDQLDEQGNSTSIQLRDASLSPTLITEDDPANPTVIIHSTIKEDNNSTVSFNSNPSMVIRPGIQTVGKTVKAQWNMWSAATLIKTMVQEQLAHKKSMDSSSTTTSSAVSIHDLPDSMVIVEGVEERHPAKLTIKKTVIAEKSKQKTRAVPTESEEDDIEARLCLELGQLPGVWPTHKLTKVNGYWAMIQECAGYKTESGYKAVELSDMADFAAENLLSVNDQIMFLNMIEDTLKGIQSIHKKGYIHRDIKPQNALCGNRGRAGISDIGEACKNELDNNAKRSIVGTPYYIAPEIVRYNNPAVGSDQWKQIDTKADIWSLGVCLWHLLNKEKHPSISFLGTNPVGAAYKAGSFFLPQINTLYENKYPEPQDKDSLAHLIWQCTRVEPTARLDINEVVSKYQRWKEEAIEMVKAEEKNVMEFLVG